MIGENAAQSAIGAGHGNALWLDINPAINRAENVRRENATLARVKAQQAAEAQAKKQKEIDDLLASAPGDAGYLTNIVNQQRQELNNRLLKQMEEGKPVDLPRLRAENAAFDGMTTMGKTLTEQMKARFPDLEQKNFIKTPQFERALTQNLAEDYDAHIKAGNSPLTYQMNPNRLMERAMNDHRYDIYDVPTLGSKVRANYPMQGGQQKPVAGQTTFGAKGSGLLKLDANGVPTKEVDPVLLQQELSNPAYVPVINQRFNRELNNANSPYFEADLKNRQQFGEGTPEYAQATENLRQQYAMTDFPKEAGLIPANLSYDPQWTVTAGRRGGQGAPQKIEFVEGAPSEISFRQWANGKKAFQSVLLNYAAPVTGTNIPIDASYDVNGMTPDKQKGRVSAYTPTDDYLGITAIPFTRAPIKGSKGTLVPNTAINQQNLKSVAGDGPYTYNGKTYATMADLLASDAVKYEPAYVYNAGIYLDKTNAKDQLAAKLLGVDLQNEGSKIYPVGQRFVKASAAPNLETATLSGKNPPTREQWNKAKQEAVEATKLSHGRQFKKVPASASFFQKPTGQTQAAPLNYLFPTQ